MILKISPYVLCLESVYYLYSLYLGGFHLSDFSSQLFLYFVLTPSVIVSILLLLSAYGLVHKKRWAIIYIGLSIVLPEVIHFVATGGTQISLLSGLNLVLATYFTTKFWTSWKSE